MKFILFFIVAYIIFAALQILYFKRLEKKYKNKFNQSTGNIFETTRQKS
jgi:hypothetical protein